MKIIIWIASLVAEFSRVLSRGGIFLYPRDKRKGYEEGRLRLLYEAYATALMIEEAGGLASDGKNNILDVKTKDIHQKTPLFFGSYDEMKKLLGEL